jgi:hypothetical protein
LKSTIDPGADERRESGLAEQLGKIRQVCPRRDRSSQAAPGQDRGVDRRGVEVGVVGVDDAPLAGARRGVGGDQLVDQRLDVGGRLLAQASKAP